METRIKELCDQVRETAYAIHKYHGTGHLEKVYDEDGTEIGDYYADLIVEGMLIIELKACKAFAEEHKAQIIGYLRSADIEHGLLINFGSFKFQIQKFVLAKSGNSSAISKTLSLLFSFAFLALFRG